jgi:hypothetical protein
MGLDMYLKGCTKAALAEMRKERDFKPSELGYWRKHPDLHGYIVQTYAAGVDECQEIPLTAADLRGIADACNARKLTHTSGFFFGESSWTYNEDPTDEASAATLRKAAEWLEEDADRAVYYRASW